MSAAELPAGTAAGAWVAVADWDVSERAACAFALRLDEAAFALGPLATETTAAPAAPPATAATRATAISEPVPTVRV